MLGNLAEIARGVKLPNPQTSLLDAGFKVRDGCYFLASLMPAATDDLGAQFPDKTSQECFINSIHTYDHCESGELSVALAFIAALLKEWSRTDFKKTLRVVLSYRPDDTVVKWHVVRDGENWLSEDLDDFEESILEISSTEPWPWS
jgi:hypothetical protein